MAYIATCENSWETIAATVGSGSNAEEITLIYCSSVIANADPQTLSPWPDLTYEQVGQLSGAVLTLFAVAWVLKKVRQQF
ncbi:hypothetical protein [Thiohalomonas denitrificans]|uniref:hypothetical protein n=1 Tax=Thiohalomonas denitrificans TaxID=415747 RepID=UPI000B878500|nr:hypothetical protein [Thiohalomonas denitrificans]